MRPCGAVVVELKINSGEQVIEQRQIAKSLVRYPDQRKRIFELPEFDAGERSVQRGSRMLRIERKRAIQRVEGFLSFPGSAQQIPEVIPRIHVARIHVYRPAIGLDGFHGFTRGGKSDALCVPLIGGRLQGQNDRANQSESFQAHLAANTTPGLIRGQTYKSCHFAN